MSIDSEDYIKEYKFTTNIFTTIVIVYIKQCLVFCLKLQ